MADLINNTIKNDEDIMKDRFLTFQIGKEIFGIEIKNISKIIGIQPITELPEMPDYFKGIIYLREKIIPVIDIGIRFKLPGGKYNDRTCVIIITSGDVLLGLIVDSISGILTITDKNISYKTKHNIKNNHGYVKGIGKINNSVILLIDCMKFFSDDSHANST